MVHTCDRCNKEFKKLWMLNRHLQNRKFPCRPRIIPVTNPIPQIDPEAGPGPSTQAHREEISQEEINLLIALGLIEEPEIEECWPELGGTLLVDEAKSKKFRSQYRDSGLASITVKPPPGDILFEETEVGDPDRPHSSLSSLSKWQAIVPSIENPAY